MPTGPIPLDYADRPDPDPAAFGLPTEDDGSWDDPLMEQNIISGTTYEFDFDALRAASARIVLAHGAGSMGEMVSGRLGRSGASRNNAGHLSQPSRRVLGRRIRLSRRADAFAEKLREVLGAPA
jgi:hypothetical protein